MEPKNFSESKQGISHAAVERLEDDRQRLIKIRVLRSAKYQNRLFTIWETSNVSSYVRSLPKCNVFVA